jgi:hypothetical protein
MTIYTLENETGNITAFPTAEAAVAANETPFDVFTSQQELAELMANWPADRLLSTYNNLPGVAPLKRLQDPKRAAARIWQRIAKLWLPVEGDPEPSPKAKAATKANAGARAAQGAAAKGKPSRKATAAKTAATKGKKRKTSTAKTPVAPRAGSKMAQVITLLQRKGAVSISELMKSMGWQRHTVRGFMAGAMKKAGFAVESFKPDGGDRSYRLPK